MLTGNKQTDFLVLQKLSDKDLESFCQIDNYAKSLCEDEQFWINRIVSKSDKDVLNGKKKEQTYRDYYTSGRYIAYRFCRDLRTVSRSQLVIDDLYNPMQGFIPQGILRAGELLTYLIIKLTLQVVRLKYNDKNYENQLEKLLGKIYNQIAPWDMEAINYQSTDFSFLDKTKLLQIINQKVSRSNFLQIFPKVNKTIALELNKKHPLHEYAKFILYIHDGIKSEQIPLDIEWKDLCSYDYVLNY